MDDLVERLPDRRPHARMVVPDRGAYLAGGEVEHPPPPCRLHERALRPDDQFIEERAPVADQPAGSSIIHGRQSSSASGDASGGPITPRPDQSSADTSNGSFSTGCPRCSLSAR